MPDFRSNLQRQIYLPPYQMLDSNIFAFIFQGDENMIQGEIVDQSLSPPGESDFELLMNGKFLIQFIYHNHLSSMNGLDANRGFFKYRESVIYLVVRHRKSGKKFWFSPAMFLDSFSPIVVGREIYGISKNLGEVVCPETLSDETMEFSVHSEVLPIFHPSTAVASSRIYEIETTAGRADDSDSHHGISVEHDAAVLNMEAFSERARGEFEQISDSADVEVSRGAWDLFHVFLSMTKPGIFLKQLPTADGGSGAVYQELITSKFKPTRLGKFRFLRKYRGTFYDHASLPLASSLGVPDGVAINAELGFSVSADFIAEPGSPANLD